MIEKVLESDAMLFQKAQTLRKLNDGGWKIKYEDLRIINPPIGQG